MPPCGHCRDRGLPPPRVPRVVAHLHDAIVTEEADGTCTNCTQRLWWKHATAQARQWRRNYRQALRASLARIRPADLRAWAGRLGMR